MSPNYLPREPTHEPELLELTHYPDGIAVLGKAYKCGYATCDQLAVYEGRESNGAHVYYCGPHGEEAAEYAGLEVADT